MGAGIMIYFNINNSQISISNPKPIVSRPEWPVRDGESNEHTQFINTSSNNKYDNVICTVRNGDTQLGSCETCVGVITGGDMDRKEIIIADLYVPRLATRIQFSLRIGWWVSDKPLYYSTSITSSVDPNIDGVGTWSPEVFDPDNKTITFSYDLQNTYWDYELSNNYDDNTHNLTNYNVMNIPPLILTQQIPS